jgi:N-formylglutamate amidohydrolase
MLTSNYITAPEDPPVGPLLSLGLSFDILVPASHTAPVVFASPHSGRRYPAEFLAVSRLDATAIRRSEDAFVDELFASAPLFGAPLIRAHMPRAYIDMNRGPYELDPAMFIDALPMYANTSSPRVAAGLGTVARIVASGEPIYQRKLLVADALTRIENYHIPYHLALSQLMMETQERFGGCLLVDCHSMPSSGRPIGHDTDGQPADMILGDRHGVACHPAIIDVTELTLRDMGYVVHRNVPYAGGYSTCHYGRPADGLHAIQIEINRGLYMDESRITRSPGFMALTHNLENLIKVLTGLNPKQLPL